MGSLTAEQIEFFNEEGYLVVRDLFSDQDFNPLRGELTELIDAKARELHAANRLSEIHEAAPFNTRLSLLAMQEHSLAGELFAAIEGKGGGKVNGPGIYSLLTHAPLLDAMESLLGSEIVGSSVYRVRPKLPNLGRGNVPWHQDSGYFSPHCDGSLIVTCWIPLVEATVESGCLSVLPRAHRNGIIPHRTGGNAGFLVIEDEAMDGVDEAIPVPVPLGGALLMTNMTPHCSTPNTSDYVRWSVDLRYQAADVPTNADQDPDDFDPGAAPESIACYAPEGDFFVRSRTNPARALTYDQFRDRRARYESANLPSPNRGWLPVAKH